ncbi:thymidine phosphorylase family protein [Elongatibacter sediminis]|uniref:Putative thymidine phosphorylase n=1 Tax=Elongatibacter sediminis TaxID=3119006 RepID=A0AAW9R823_9GAMM
MIQIPKEFGVTIHEPSRLTARSIGIDTYQEPVAYMREDCPVCRSEGFEAQSRVLVTGNRVSIVATLNVVRGDWLAHDEIGLSEIAWQLLGSNKPCPVTLSHPDPVESFRHVRAKLFGHTLSSLELRTIIDDVAGRRYSDVQSSAFLAACVGGRMTSTEIVELTRAMVESGERLEWPQAEVFDKHCVGGLPGNRTTPIVVSIVTACGVIMPKTSSRAITSPAGTADTMETLTTVDLSLDAMRTVVEREGGCLVWGGGVDLSPADDMLIRIERALDIDSEAQLVASVLSKKIAAGSTHTIIDIPVGETAKVRDRGTADRLAEVLRHTGDALGLNVQVVVTDGSQPVGRGIGPALEARDVLQVLQNHPDAPQDLRDRAILLAGLVFEQSGVAGTGEGSVRALEVLEDGHAWKKFQAICEAQGGLRTPPQSSHQQILAAECSGRISTIDNRRLAKVAKLAGAPNAPAAGVDLHVHLGDCVEVGAPIMTVHAESPGELAYALGYLSRHPDLVAID